MTLRALLDVNVLIALLDASHLAHAAASEWLARHIDQGWASCPLTQNACIRIMSQPSYPASRPAAEVADRLSEAARHPSHRFWPADVSLLSPQVLAWSHVLGHRQITDNYLLALAVHHDGCFVSFDKRISLAAVPGAQPKHFELLSVPPAGTA